MEGAQLLATLPISWWVFLGGGLAVMAIAIWRVPKLWRHEDEHFDEPWYGWRWGDALWRGYVRALPAAMMGCGILAVAVPLLVLVPGDPQGPFASPYWAVLPALAALALPLALMATAMLFNRPKCIVPPHLRAQPGAVTELVAAWRGRRSGGADGARLGELDRPLEAHAKTVGSMSSSSPRREPRSDGDLEEVT